MKDFIERAKKIALGKSGSQMGNWNRFAFINLASKKERGKNGMKMAN